MTTKQRNQEWVARAMIVIVLFAGLFGMTVQFFGDLKDIAILVGIAVFGGLVASSNNFDEREQQLLSQTYSMAFQWLFFALLVAYAFLEVCEWLNAANSITVFLNTHWLGLTVSLICLLLGMAGLRLFKEE